MNRLTTRKQRQTRIRKNIAKVSDYPRLSVFRSNKFIYAQIIDDKQKKTLLSVNMDKTIKSTKTESAKSLGVALAKEAVAKKITKVVFDKGSYAYHGRVKALAEGAREGGLIF